MEENKKYKVTISCSVILGAKDEETAKKIAIELFEIGPGIITSVECEEVQYNMLELRK